MQSGKYNQISEDIGKLKGTKEPHSIKISVRIEDPKNDEKTAQNNKSSPPNPSKSSAKLDENPMLHQELHERPKVSYLSNLEATVDLNKDDTQEKKKFSEKTNTPVRIRILV